MEIRYKAKDLHGKWVDGYFAILHIPEFDEHDNQLMGLTPSYEIFNDEIGSRKGGYWTTINKDTLCISTMQEDIHGKLIYSHDIIKMTNKRYERTVTGMVFYDMVTAAFICVVDTDTMKSDYNTHVHLDMDLWSIEVIGNFFDHGNQ